MSLPWLKGAISGSLSVDGLTVTAAHFSAKQGWEGGKRRVEWSGRGGGGGACCAVFVHEAVRRRLGQRLTTPNDVTAQKSADGCPRESDKKGFTGKGAAFVSS